MEQGKLQDKIFEFVAARPETELVAIMQHCRAEMPNCFFEDVIDALGNLVSAGRISYRRLMNLHCYKAV